MLMPLLFAMLAAFTILTSHNGNEGRCAAFDADYAYFRHCCCHAYADTITRHAVADIDAMLFAIFFDITILFFLSLIISFRHASVCVSVDAIFMLLYILRRRCFYITPLFYDAFLPPC